MDLNEDFISIQGIFLTIERNMGILKKIKFKGGNECTILIIIAELEKFLSSKNYIKNTTLNSAFDEQIKNIVLFLLLNTEFKKPIDQSEYAHLINIMPQLSLCILANVIIGLELSEPCCKILENFPLNITEELLSEIVPCLKKCKPNVLIKNSHTFLHLIIHLLSSSTKEDPDSADKLTNHASVILLNLTGLHGDHVINIRITKVYENMGQTILNLLNLLLISNEKDSSLSRIIEKILKTCCSIAMAVTLEVFCTWAEIEYETQTLQNMVAEKSYMVIEKYQKYPHAKELIGLLATMAQKPKTVQDLIYQADTSSMIAMVNKADINQKLWFRALINTQVLKCEESVKCVSRWAHLCTSEDVSRLLNMSVHTKDPEARRTVIKCASTLELDELILVTTRHFYQNGIANLNDNIQQQIVLLFNKIKDKNVDEEFSKELHLLLLQNPEQTLCYIFGECLKNAFYLYSLKKILHTFKEIANVNNIGIKVLSKEIDSNKPNDVNSKNYVELLNALVEVNFYSVEAIVIVILLPLLRVSYKDKDYELLKVGLSILNSLNESIDLKQETERFYVFIFEIMKNCRCKFLEFNLSKQEVVKEAVGLIEKHFDTKRHSSHLAQTVKFEEDMFTTFYKRKLFDNDTHYTIVKHLFPCNFENHAEIVTYMIKILPLCVIHEWLRICTELIEICGAITTATAFCDALNLLCQSVDSTDTKTEEAKCMFNALKYCLQNFGIVVKECIQSKLQSLEEDITFTKKMCLLLKNIPASSLKSEEGLSLASLISDTSLTALSTDKQFATLVFSINEVHINQMLAQKMLQ